MRDNNTKGDRGVPIVLCAARFAVIEYKMKVTLTEKLVATVTLNIVLLNASRARARSHCTRVDIYGGRPHTNHQRTHKATPSHTHSTQVS